MFGVGNKIKVWRVEKKDKYTICQISSSVKNKKTNKYETDFNGYANFIGKAHNLEPQVGDIIKIKECGVTTKYDNVKRKQYTNCTVFDYELIKETSSNPFEHLENVINDEEELPF